jgi:NAD+ synthetase
MNRYEMIDGFLKVSAVTPNVKVADVDFNVEEIIKNIHEERNADVKLCVFPELCITAYTCNDLFRQKTLLDSAKKGLKKIVEDSTGYDMLVFVGLPFEYRNKLYNVCACVQNGKLLALIPKTHLPNYNEFYEVRYFTRGMRKARKVKMFGYDVFFGTDILLKCSNLDNLCVAAEICEDLWVSYPPSTLHTMNGATVIVNISASDELVGKSVYRDSLISMHSASTLCAYIYANAGEGESTQDLVFGGHNIIAKNGEILNRSTRFKNGRIRADIDLQRIDAERRRLSTYEILDDDYAVVEFELDKEKFYSTSNIYLRDRFIDARPFIPKDSVTLEERCNEVLDIQAIGLKKRIEHVKPEAVILGLSGGLDSTLALIVCAKTYDLLGIDRSKIHAVTMPGFGTTGRTYANACELARAVGATLEEVSIVESVKLHLQDIKHDLSITDTTYENAQARERTQILMDIANRDNGFVVGTGDLSELALGWATYNGDQMSMYSVNSSIPKTLVKYVVKYYAIFSTDERLKKVLFDILDTPISPELLPPVKGEISQKTEDFVGPYELHDFFIYNILRYGFPPAKIYRLANKAFENEYSLEDIYKWINKFYYRFFSQQFKRSCMPDGPKVGSIGLSPRGDLRMPTDAEVNLWIKELEELAKDQDEYVKLKKKCIEKESDCTEKQDDYVDIK